MKLRSKLPQVGTTIFTVMTERARALGAINLAQGFPDFEPPALLKQLLTEQVAAGHNQYAPMVGCIELREQIAELVHASRGYRPDPDTDVTITVGAAEAIFSAVQALVHPGDEVIMFDPSYDAYAPSVRLAGGTPIHLPLTQPDFRIDFQRLRDTLSPRTRLVMFNTPHNPSATVLSRADLDQLAELLRDTEALVLSDEVYDHMIFDGVEHASIQSHDELRQRGISVYSFGKTLHATGWRLGYAIAPQHITDEVRRVHQFNTFSIDHPMQRAIAEFMRQCPGHHAELAAFYQAKRDRFLSLVEGSRFTWTPAAGTYFQLLDFSNIAPPGDVEFADVVLRKAGVAAIPLSAFYNEPPALTVLRFCFAKSDATLEAAAERLHQL